MGALAGVRERVKGRVERRGHHPETGSRRLRHKTAMMRICDRSRMLNRVERLWRIQGQQVSKGVANGGSIGHHDHINTFHHLLTTSRRAAAAWPAQRRHRTAPLPSTVAVHRTTFQGGPAECTHRTQRRTSSRRSCRPCMHTASCRTHADAMHSTPTARWCASTWRVTVVAPAMAGRSCSATTCPPASSAAGVPVPVTPGARNHRPR